jgi:hypothetical protein
MRRKEKKPIRAQLSQAQCDTSNDDAKANIWSSNDVSCVAWILQTSFTCWHVYCTRKLIWPVYLFGSIFIILIMIPYI